jgi:hypothetical protein
VAKRPVRCFSCDSPLKATFLYCPFCGVRLDSGVGESTDPGEPESAALYVRERPRLFGVAPQDTMLTLGTFALALSLAAFATGRLVSGIVLLIAAFLFLLTFAEAMRRRPGSIIVRRAVAGARVLRTQLGFAAVAIVARAATWTQRVRLRLESASLSRSRRERLLTLGTAVHADDGDAEAEARAALADLDASIAANKAKTEGLERRAALRIRAARLARRRRSTEESPTVIGRTAP